MKTYRGWRRADGIAFVRIVTNGELRRLSLRHDLCSHSSSSFEWGRRRPSRSWPMLRHDPSAIGLHQPFKFKVIATLPSPSRSVGISRCAQGIPRNSASWPSRNAGWS
jgi:hypothetical protein